MLLDTKNMVCQRCKLAVKDALEKSGLDPMPVSLGEVIIEEKELSNMIAALYSSSI